MKTGKKILLAWALLALLLFLSYSFAISKTLTLQREHNTLVQERELYKDIPQQISYLVGQERYYDSILGQMNRGNTSLENNLLRMLNTEAEKNAVKVMDFSNPHIFKENETQLNTYIFSLEGGFTDMLKCLHHLEQKGNFGEMVHLDLLKETDHRRHKKYLRTTVFIQNIE
jgi:hypothetical protein